MKGIKPSPAETQSAALSLSYIPSSAGGTRTPTNRASYTRALSIELRRHATQKVSRVSALIRVLSTRYNRRNCLILLRRIRMSCKQFLQYEVQESNPHRTLIRCLPYH